MGISKNSFKGSIQLPKWVNSNPVTITVSKNILQYLILGIH